MIKLFFDVETTGTDYRKHSIIQLAGMIEKDGKVVEEFNFLVKPHEKAQIDDAAMAVNKKTVEEIMQYPKMKDIHLRLLKILGKYVDKYEKSDKMWLVGFNNRAFDDTFLRMFFELNGDRFFNSWFWSDSLDVLSLASQYLLNRRAQMPSFKLKRVAKELGIPVSEDELHDALYDVRLTRQIYRIVTRLELEPSDELF